LEQRRVLDGVDEIVGHFCCRSRRRGGECTQGVTMRGLIPWCPREGEAPGSKPQALHLCFFWLRFLPKVEGVTSYNTHLRAKL